MCCCLFPARAPRLLVVLRVLASCLPGPGVCWLGEGRGSGGRMGGFGGVGAGAAGVPGGRLTGAVRALARACARWQASLGCLLGTGHSERGPGGAARAAAPHRFRYRTAAHQGRTRVDLFEYQAKDLFADYGVPFPRARSPTPRKRPAPPRRSSSRPASRASWSRPR